MNKIVIWGFVGVFGMTTGCMQLNVRKPPAPIVPKGQVFIESAYDDTVSIKPPSYIFPVSPRASLILDLDFDRVDDELDNCLNTPPNTKVDLKGCPLPVVADSDKDGVSDSLDKCPNTPSNVKVDGAGCPLDSDKDGVKDYLDKCANTPANTKVDAKGCPYPAAKPTSVTHNKGGTGGNNLNKSGGSGGGGNSSAPINVNVVNNNYINGINLNDKDQDGVNDDQDKCANTPSNTQVDNNGCPIKSVSLSPSASVNDDDDKDGVKNAIDKCPRTPLGQKVDAQGCALGDEVFISLSVLFATNKATIVDNAFVDILKVAAFMRDYPDVVVTIEGHTDDRASIDHNQKLSQRRAEAVRKELIRFGADAQKMIAIGYGELKSIASNDTEAGRAQNRRVIATAKINKQVKE
jgi:OOP family OmpA-OmpF porin